jgi:hypothetical protein
MTPKEKAKELTFKYEDLVTTWDCYYDCDIEIEDRLPSMKECALIAVNEILELLKILERNNSYFLEVKQEIEKLC